MCERVGRAGAVADRLVDVLKVGHGHKTTAADNRVARLVPVRVGLAAHDVEEIAGTKAEMGRVVGVGVVEAGFDDLSSVSRGPACRRHGARAGLAFLGGTMAMASLGWTDRWCGFTSLSPFIDRRSDWQRVSGCAGRTSRGAKGAVPASCWATRSTTGRASEADARVQQRRESDGPATG